MKVGDKRITWNWLSARECPYGDPNFGEVLSSKIKQLTTNSSLGAGGYLHYNNVAVAYTHLYGFDMEGVGANAAVITRSGNQGSIAEMRIPANAGLLSKAWNIVVGPELNWSCDATTTDAASEAQAVTMRNALAYCWHHEGFGAKGKQVAFEALAFAEGAMHIPWDMSLGTDVGVEQTAEGEERLVRSGDWRFTSIPTWDIIRDPTAKSFDQLNWIIVREWQNKFDVAEMCETDEQREAVMNAAPPMPEALWAPFQYTYNQDTDRIAVYYLYALRKPSIPGGREAMFLSDGTVLSDKPLSKAYADLPGSIGPVVVMRAGEYSGTPWPYTKFFGTLGAEQARDALYRDLLTNATAVAGNIISAEQSTLDLAMAADLFSGGPQIMPRPDGKEPPSVLQLQQSHPEHFKLTSTLGNEVQQILGIDNITAGSADVAKDLSGAAMALMTSTSVQNNSQWQASWTKFVQACGNVVLRHVQHNMTVPKRIALAGNARASLVTSFEVSGDKVQGIQRVFCTIGSALQQTDAGKYTMMEQAIKNQWVQTPEQAQTVLDTGRYDALTQELSNELLLINHENEALGRGEEVVVMLDDNHALHIKSHRSVTSSLSARQDPAIVQALQAHQDWHLRVLRETDPAILALFGQPTVGTPPGMPPGGDPGAPPSPQGEAQAPSLPTNPATGEEAAPAAGTMPPNLAIQ